MNKEKGLIEFNETEPHYVSTILPIIIDYSIEFIDSFDRFVCLFLMLLYIQTKRGLRRRTLIDMRQSDDYEYDKLWWSETRPFWIEEKEMIVQSGQR
ncbi:hypothetical protein BLOT_015318 [Blomia tropicalis]|nr:hypothetical protein BLOT_015318 [Blomia tropicalis]